MDLQTALIELENAASKKDQILDLIREALDEFGTYWNRDKVDKVTTTFLSEIIGAREVCDGVC